MKSDTVRETSVCIQPYIHTVYTDYLPMSVAHISRGCEVGTSVHVEGLSHLLHRGSELFAVSNC